MSLLDEFSQEYILMEKTRVPDGESGFKVTWRDGIKFTMPQAHETTIEAQKAEREGTASTYTFLPAKGMAFDYHDIFRRVSDGQYFRVTSPSMEIYTPASTDLNRTMIKAEKWVMAS